MRTPLEFRTAPYHHYALADCASVGAILSDQNLTRKIPRTHFTANVPIHALVSEYRNASQAGLSALADLLFYDLTVSTRIGLEATGLRQELDRSPLSELVCAVEIETDVYEKVKSALERFCNEAEQQNLDMSEIEGDFDDDLKKEVDLLLSKQRPLLTRIAESSGPVLLRALFYFELSNVGHLPMILHPLKAAFINRFKQFMTAQPASKVIREIVTRAQMEAFETEPFEVPSLEMLILRKAQNDGLSPIEAAIRIHKSEECQDFRSFLRNIQLAIFENDQLNKSKQCERLREYVKRWVDNLDAREGLGLLTRVFRFIGVPGIGSDSLQIEPAPEIRISERPLRWISRPPLYLFFVSDWFSGKPQFLK